MGASVSTVGLDRSVLLHTQRRCIGNNDPEPEERFLDFFVRIQVYSNRRRGRGFALHLNCCDVPG